MSFVSITQQFNTTTSMGRLTLNVLLSFAQFEREVTGERIRDKIAASKKKGMWMGGFPSLGYDVQNRKLVVNEEEARTAIQIFRRYLALKSVEALRAELESAGIRSKRRRRPDGAEFGGQKLSRGALYLMLQNRIYRGEITHKGNAYPGEHTAIVDEVLWDEVQAVLAANRVDRITGANVKYPSLLTGMVFDEAGQRLTPTYSVKRGTRYRYYVSTTLITRAAKNPPKGLRIPAANLESLVLDRLGAFLADQGALLDIIHNELPEGIGQNQLIRRGRQISEELRAMTPDKTKTILMTLVSRVDVRSDCIEISVRRLRLVALLSTQSLDLALQDQIPRNDSNDTLALIIPARLQRVGPEMRILIENTGDETTADPGFLRIVARAHDLQSRLMHNTELTVHEIASQEQVSGAYVYCLLRLPSLAPDIVTAIVNGRQPRQLTAKKLMRLSHQLPIKWVEQRKLLGFH